jgi:AcrR family transcriptional regulator
MRTGSRYGPGTTSTRPDPPLIIAAQPTSPWRGILYRHFPTRESLILEIYQHELQQLIDLAPALLAGHEPLAALRRWFAEVARYGQLKYGVAEVIHAATSGGIEDEYLQSFLHALARLLDAGAADGSLKQALDPRDVLLQLSALWRINPAGGGQAQAARILGLIIDGLRAAPGMSPR